MALSLLNGLNGGRCNSAWDPFWSESAWGPFELVHLAPSRSVADGAKAIAGANVDWLETGEAHVIRADLPGLKKEDIKVELDDRTLSISGERNEEEEKEGHTWHTIERSRGKFLSRFKLPRNAQADSVSSKVENGVLTVTVPKLQTKESRKRSIEVS